MESDPLFMFQRDDIMKRTVLTRVTKKKKFNQHKVPKNYVVVIHHKYLVTLSINKVGLHNVSLVIISDTNIYIISISVSPPQGSSGATNRPGEASYNPTVRGW